MPLAIPNPIEPLTPADAAEVEQNNSVIQQYINANAIVKQGTVAMTAPLTLYSSPTQAQHAASKAYVDALLPVGVIMPFGGTSAPEGNWALCNGATLQSANFPKLYAVIGHRFGGTGGNFMLPDIRGRFLLGVNPTEDRFDSIGGKGGTWQVSLREHFHTMNHNHGSFASGAQSASHHHSIAHNHGTVKTTDAGTHSHTGSYQNNVETTGASVRLVGYTASGLHATTTDTEPNHSHNVDMPNFTGDSGNQSASHTHTVDVPNFTGNTANAGTDNAEHLSPYLIINYIIRVG